MAESNILLSKRDSNYYVSIKKKKITASLLPISFGMVVST